MRRSLIQLIQKDLASSTMHTPDAAYLAGRLEKLVYALLEDEKPINVSPPGLVQLDEWARGDEVRNYARFHDITLSEAIKRLVNSGLSHEHRGWTS